MTQFYEKILTRHKLRLITILPAKEVSATVKCEVNEFEIDDLHVYEALSYVWGDPNKTTKITVNGQPFEVTLNLHDALARLRFHDSNRIIWADAICINQASNEEKSKHVPLLGRIYSNATRVVAWLGNAEREEATAAAQSLQHISDACREHKRSPDFNEQDPLPYRSVQPPPEIYEGLSPKSLRRFFSSPWFERVWCVQEIQLARDAVIIWGEQEIRPSNIVLASSWAIHRRLDPSNALGGLISINGGLMLNSSKRQDSILNILLKYKTFLATNPRDNVYGLLYLMKSETVAQFIKVDYGKTVAEVYADAAVAAICELSDLSILSHVNHYPNWNEEYDLKSWAPSWHLPEENAWTNHVSMGHTSCSLNVETRSACKHMPMNSITLPFTVRHPDNGSLQLRGLIFDQVASIRPAMSWIYLSNTESTEPHCLDEQNTIMEFLSDVLARRADESVEMVSTAQALARTLTAGMVRDRDGYWPSVTSMKSTEDERNLYSGFVDYIENRFSHLYQTYIASLKPLQTEMPLAGDEYRIASAVVCDYRRLFTTTTGSYGLGPACMREGDVIVVLFGGGTPYAARPKADEYLFLGEVYIDELMDGKLVDDMQAGKVHEVEICLI